jgi:DNA polymerase III epsilon subunit-like protein
MIAQVILTKKLHNKIYVLLDCNFIMKEMIKLVHSITPTCLHPFKNDRTRRRNVHPGAGARERIP